MRKPIRIANANPKGGVGKSTSITALALALVSRNYKVLVIDLDTVRSASSYLLGEGVTKRDYSTVADLFVEEKFASTIKVYEVSENLHLIQGDLKISAIGRTDSFELIGLLGENIEKHIPNIGTYDYILLDTPGSSGAAVLGAFLYADYVYSPIKLDQHATSSLAELIDILKVSRRYNTKLKWIGILINDVKGMRNNGDEKTPHQISEREKYDELVGLYKETAILGVISQSASLVRSVSKAEWLKPTAETRRSIDEFNSFVETILEKTK